MVQIDQPLKGYYIVMFSPGLSHHTSEAYTCRRNLPAPCATQLLIRTVSCTNLGFTVGPPQTITIKLWTTAARNRFNGNRAEKIKMAKIEQLTAGMKFVYVTRSLNQMESCRSNRTCKIWSSEETHLIWSKFATDLPNFVSFFTSRFSRF